VAAYSWFFAHGNIFCFLCVMVLDKNSFFLKGFEKYMLSFTVRVPVPERNTGNLAFTRLKTQGIF
jgi:hypothetical protein